MHDPLMPDHRPEHASVLQGETAQRIIAIALELIQTKGYSAISYQDISDRLGIRKASIHYHFPAKADLGIAVIEAYSGALQAHLRGFIDDERLTTADLFTHYCGPFRQFAATPDTICLCAALAGEILVLPEAMRRSVKAFFAMHEAWLEAMLVRGVARGEVSPDVDPRGVARAVFAALQGALLMRRTTGDPAQLEEVIATARTLFLGL